MEKMGLRCVRSPPGAQIEPVEDDAEHVRGNEAQLRSAQPDDANDDAVDGCQNPAFPMSFAHENRRKNGKDARKIIQTEHDDKSLLNGNYRFRAERPSVIAHRGGSNEGRRPTARHMLR